MRRWILWAALVLAGCSGKSGGGNAPPPAKPVAPEPLPRLSAPAPEDGGTADREAAYRVAPAPVYGRKAPEDAVRVELSGGQVEVAGQAFAPERPADAAALKARLGEKRPVLLVPDEDTFLAQAAPLLALLDDAGVETWLLHPQGAVAYPLALRDEPSFQAWLEEPKPGRVRVIFRADGYEISTNIGKLPGADPNGPSVPLRGGQLDLASLRRGLGLVKGRFKSADEACLVPSFGTELAKVAASFSAFFREQDTPTFETLCLVYPRPRGRDGG